MTPLGPPPEEAGWVLRAAELAEGFRAVAARHDETAELPIANLEALHGAGFDVAWLPVSRGGRGLSWRTFAAVVTEVARACPSTATVWLMHLGAAYGLVGMSEDAGFYAAELAAGRRFATALSEPAGGNLFLRPAQVASPVPGGWRLDGAKRFVSGCEFADWFLVNAVVDGEPAFFAVRPDDTLDLVPIWDSMGQRATRSQLVTFDGTVLRADRRCTRRSEAANPVPVGLPLLSIGVADAAWETLRAYAKSRVVPGTGEPLASMQWLQFAAAEVHVRLEAARLLAGRVAWLADTDPAVVPQEAMAAKLMANEVAKEVAALGVRVGGGSGFLRGSDIQRHFRDAQAGALMAYSAEVCQAAIGERLFA